MSKTAHMDNGHDEDLPGAGGVADYSLFTGADDFDEALGTRVAWRTAAVLFWVAGFGALAQLSTGLISAPIEYPALTVAVSIFAIVMGCVWWVVGNLVVDERWLHFGVILSYGILVVMFANAPSVESELGVVYLVPLIYVALFLPSRALFGYIGLSVALIMLASLRHPDSQFGLLPGLLTIVALASTAGLTLYVRLELNRIGRQAITLSGRDALTGLSNLRPLYERVERGLQEAERGHGGITVVMIDLEGFKRVNDEYSHSVGDETLRVVAQAISDTVRKDELVARRGGDEFAIVTGATDQEDIQTLIRRVSHNVSDARVDLLPGVRSGVTVGYATNIEGDTVGRLLARADRELNDAKANAKIERWSWRQRKLNDLADELGAD
ncbi:MAG: GGDEF domain-containing protein [Thermoleophilaceae bacterium]|nr:GGDEF domain-containing protein [Thermoleophilaceae bacterium]